MEQKKYIKNFKVEENLAIHKYYGLLKLSPSDNTSLPEIYPGQFVQVEIKNSPNTFLRRPISINFIDKDANQIWLLVRRAGEGTAHLLEAKCGDEINLLLPLGNGFSLQLTPSAKVLLIGGGVGVAPLLYYGKWLKEKGINPSYLVGARSANDLLEVDMMKAYGDVYISTDDGSLGEKGVVTQNSVLNQSWDFIACCGPMPMMKAVARVAKEKNIDCEVSLENMMACGLGACLCCVEKTVKGNVCVCTEGPVFNINQLTW